MSFVSSFLVFVKPIFYQIVYMSLKVSIMGLAFLIIKNAFKRILSPKMNIITWMIICVFLIIPVNIRSFFSIFNYIPYSVENALLDNYAVEASNEENIISNSGLLINSDNVEKELIKLYVWDLLTLSWIILAIGMILVLLITYFILKIKIKNNMEYSKAIIDDKKILLKIEKCKKKIGFKRKINFVIQEYIKMPSLFGIFRPNILLSPTIEKYNDNEIEHILLHEIAHAKRHDNIIIIGISLLKCIYFFNPILWIFFICIRNDIEIATDELVLENENKDYKKDYCKTLIKVSCENYDEFIIRGVCLNTTKRELSRRIELIKYYNEIRNTKKIEGFSIIVLMLVILLFGTKGKNYIGRIDAIKLLEKGNNINNYSYTITRDNDEGIIKGKKDGDTLLLKSFDEKGNEVISINHELNSNTKISGENFINEIPVPNNDNLETPNFKYILLLNDYNGYSFKSLGKELLNNEETYKVELYRKDDKYEEDIYYLLYINKKTGLVRKAFYKDKNYEYTTDYSFSL